MERFFGILKTELLFHPQYSIRAEARPDIFEYIEVFYNRLGRHLVLGYISPIKYEALPLGLNLLPTNPEPPHYECVMSAIQLSKYD